jgi:hypothetical protein
MLVRRMRSWQNGKRAVAGVALLGGSLGALLGLAAGCGPSFQAVYEGDVHFEHCYALDEDPNATITKKADCWRDWTKSYTYGQTRDRVEYAVSRRIALSRVPELPTDEALMNAAPGEGIRKTVISAPMPTSAFAPPPNTMPEVTDGGAEGGSRDNGRNPPPRLRAPGADCADDCNHAWSSCKGPCKGAECDACDRALRVCMSDCYKDDSQPRRGKKK